MPNRISNRARRLAVKWIVPAALVACMVVGAVGCSANRKAGASASASAGRSAPVTPAVLNIPAQPPVAQYTPPAAQQPVVFDPPAAAPVQAAPLAEPAAASLSDAPETAAAAPASAPRGRSTPARRWSAGSSGGAAAASKSTPKAMIRGSKYTIKKGDSLWSIAQAKYGDGPKWKAIAKANPKLNPNKILVGSTIVLP
jgi:5'-nucleotidase